MVSLLNQSSTTVFHVIYQTSNTIAIVFSDKVEASTWQSEIGRLQGGDQGESGGFVFSWKMWFCIFAPVDSNVTWIMSLIYGTLFN